MQQWQSHILTVFVLQLVSQLLRYLITFLKSLKTPEDKNVSYFLNHGFEAG